MGDVVDHHYRVGLLLLGQANEVGLQQFGGMRYGVGPYAAHLDGRGAQAVEAADALQRLHGRVADRLVEIAEVGGIETRDGEFACADIVAGEEERVDTVAGFDSEPVGHGLRDDDGVTAARAVVGKTSVREVGPFEGVVVSRGKGREEEHRVVVVRLQHSGLAQGHAEVGAGDGLFDDRDSQRVNGKVFRPHSGVVIVGRRHRDVGGKARELVADGGLEALRDGQRQQHYGQGTADADNSDDRSHAVVAAETETVGYRQYKLSFFHFPANLAFFLHAAIYPEPKTVNYSFVKT